MLSECVSNILPVFHILVKYPEIVSVSERTTVLEDNPLSLNCVVRGTPLPTVSWTSNGKAISAKKNGAFKWEQFTVADENADTIFQRITFVVDKTTFRLDHGRFNSFL